MFFTLILHQSFIDTYKWSVLKDAEFQGSSSQLDEIPRCRRHHTAALYNDKARRTFTFFSELIIEISILISY